MAFRSPKRVSGKRMKSDRTTTARIKALTLDDQMKFRRRRGGIDVISSALVNLREVGIETTPVELVTNTGIGGFTTTDGYAPVTNGAVSIVADRLRISGTNVSDVTVAVHIPMPNLVTGVEYVVIVTLGSSGGAGSRNLQYSDGSPVLITAMVGNAANELTFVASENNGLEFKSFMADGDFWDVVSITLKRVADGSVTAWRNSGVGGSDYDLDVVLGTAANLRPHESGTALMYGGVGDFISTPGVIFPTVDLDIRASLALVDWSPPTDDRTIVGNFNSSDILFRVSQTDGVLECFIRLSSSGFIPVVSTVAPTIVDGAELSVRITRTATDGEVLFFTSTDADTDTATWDQLGDAVILGAGETLDIDGVIWTVGATNVIGDDDLLDGYIRTVSVRDAINGRVIIGFDARDGGNKTGIANDTFTNTFPSLREVVNLFTASEDMTNAAYITLNGATIDSATQVTFDGTENSDAVQQIPIIDEGGGIGSRTFLFSVEVRLVSGVVSADNGVQVVLEGNAISNGSNNIGDQITSSYQRFTVSRGTDAAGTLVSARVRSDDAITLEITNWQLEESTDYLDPTLPSEYVSTGVPFGDEILINGNFETGIDGWKTDEADSVVTYDSVLKGIKVLQNPVGATARTDLLEEFPTTVGKPYTFSVKVLDSGSPSIADAYISINSSFGTNLLALTNISVGETASGTFVATETSLQIVLTSGSNNLNGFSTYGSISIRAVTNGIQLFPTFNGNTVTNNIVTPGIGAPFTRSNEWTLNGNTFIQNTSRLIVNSIGDCAIESTLGKTLNFPMTIFLVAKTNVLDLAAHYLTSSRVDTNQAAEIRISSSDEFFFNAGGSLIVGQANLDMSLHTVRYNGGSTTSYEVSGIGSMTGSAGSDDYEYGTIFANSGGVVAFDGSIARYIIFDRALTDVEVATVQAQLIGEHNIY